MRLKGSYTDLITIISIILLNIRLKGVLYRFNHYKKYNTTYVHGAFGLLQKVTPLGASAPKGPMNHYLGDFGV